MVHPLVITAAATAGVGAAVAFELAIFKPWREENWPNGFAEGIRIEFQKFRQELEQAVTEIQDDFRSMRSERRRGQHHDRLSDDELNDFRQGVGEEGSREQIEFEMHERETSAYRDRLRASMSSQVQPNDTESGLRRRPHRRDQGVNPIPSNSPETPHHALGDASPSFADVASLPEESSVKSIPGDVGARLGGLSISTDLRSSTSKDLFGLDFGTASTKDERHSTADPFIGLSDGTTSSWQAVFNETRPQTNAAGESERGSEQHFSNAAFDYSTSTIIIDHAENEQSIDGGSDHMALDTNGLSQTLSDQQHSFHHITSSHGLESDDTETTELTRDASLGTLSSHSDHGAAEEDGEDRDAEFDVISEASSSIGTGGSDDWAAMEGPSCDSAIERDPIVVAALLSDSEESWAELTDPGSESDAEEVTSARTS